MTNEENPEEWAPPNPVSPSVPSEWSPPVSSLPTPPRPPRGSAGTAPSAPTTSISTGPIVATGVGGSRWAGRALALGAAVMLIGGGGYLALNAGGRDGGADSPAAALEGALQSLAEEDLIGAAEFVEPRERETLIDAGFDMVEELVRLEVFDDTLDLSSVHGIELDFGGLEFSVVEIRPDLVHIFIERGSYVMSVDGSAVPFGPLVTDRMDSSELAPSETTGGQMISRATPVVAVQRDGRWYLSLWYSVAENARLELNEQLPTSADRVTAIGGDTPERTITNLIGALEHGDIATSIGMMDPEEMSALYDYAPLFLDEAQTAVDEFLDSARADGWVWSVDDVLVSAVTDGNLATVTIDSFEFNATGPHGSMIEVQFSPEQTLVSTDDGYGFTYRVEVADGCTTMSTNDEYSEPETQTFCNDEMFAGLGIEGLMTGGIGRLGTVQGGLVLREVDGRWFVSPVRSGSAALMSMLESLDAESLASTVDGFVELMSDPFGQSEGFSNGGGDDYMRFGELGMDSDFFAEPEIYESPVAENIGLLPNGEYEWSFDLLPGFVDEVWTGWLSNGTPTDFSQGVTVGVAGDDAVSQFEILVLSDIGLSDEAALAAMLGANVVSTDGISHVSGFSEWGPFVAARYLSGFVLVGDPLNDVVSPDAFALLVKLLDA